MGPQQHIDQREPAPRNGDDTDLSPFEQLRAHASGKRSGEFICSTDEVEVHVYLQDGAVAWATDSVHRFEFAKHLVEHTEIDREDFRRVVEECRRERLRLGETLVEWRLASWDDVQAALLHQVMLALRLLDGLPTQTPTVFLERRHPTKYDKRLTLVLDDVALSLRPPAPSQRPPEEPTRTADSLFDSLAGARWIEITAGDRTLDHAGTERADAPIETLRPLTLSDGASFFAVRAPDNCVLGANLDVPGQEVWCALRSDRAFPAALFSLVALNVVHRTDPPPEGGIGRPSKLLHWDPDVLPNSLIEPVSEIFQFGDSLLGLALLGRDHTLAGVLARDAHAGEAIGSIAQRRARVFEATPKSERPKDLDAFGFRTFVSKEADHWCFGAETHREGCAITSLWVLTRPNALQGLGWASLSSFNRVVVQSDFPDAPDPTDT